MEGSRIVKTFSAEHLLALAVILAVVGGVVTAARVRPGAWTVPVCRALAIVLVVNESSWWAWLALQGTYSINYALPFQLCDIACFVAAAALWTRRPLLVELTYFWGLAGTVNGLLTPDLPQHFPDFLAFQYFIAHGAIVGAALLLVIGLGITPRPLAALRVYAVTVVVLVVDAGVDVLTGGNYLYLRHTPGVHSLLDLFGPWPWYVLGASALALVIFVILDLPFTLGRRLARPRL
jgi:hypothetical integral membrane protein (TIGR02206 family)